MPRFRLSLSGPNNVTPPSQEEIDKAIGPHLTELGRVVFAWNEMHDKLALLFRVVAGFRSEEVAFAVWHSSKSDMGQRDMLRAAAEEIKAMYKLPRKYTAEKLDAICDILSKINAHSNRRNEALHAAFTTITEAYGERQTEFISDTSTSNQKSKYLASKDDLLKEFKWRSEWCRVVSEYVDAMAYHLMEDGGPEVDDDYPWPEKPALPHRDSN